MRKPRVIITAGLTRSVPAEALAELLHRDGVDVAGVLVVSMANLSRLLSLVRQRGLASVLRRVRTSLRPSAASPHVDTRPDPLAEFILKHRIQPRGLRNWCRQHDIPLRVVRDLNATDAVSFVQSIAPDAVVYAGGGILRPPFITAAKRVINAHAGPLPEIRGMNAAEWSALLGARPEVTVHFIDAGIDTGLVIKAFPFDRDACRSVDELRAAAVVRGLEGLRQVIGERIFEIPSDQPPASAPASRQCFIMAPVLVDKLEHSLAARRRESTA